MFNLRWLFRSIYCSSFLIVAAVSTFSMTINKQQNYNHVRGWQIKTNVTKNNASFVNYIFINSFFFWKWLCKNKPVSVKFEIKNVESLVEGGTAQSGAPWHRVWSEGAGLYTTASRTGSRWGGRGGYLGQLKSTHTEETNRGWTGHTREGRHQMKEEV